MEILELNEFDIHWDYGWFANGCWCLQWKTAPIRIAHRSGIACKCACMIKSILIWLLLIDAILQYISCVAVFLLVSTCFVAGVIHFLTSASTSPTALPALGARPSRNTCNPCRALASAFSRATDSGAAGMFLSTGAQMIILCTVVQSCAIYICRDVYWIMDSVDSFFFGGGKNGV